MKVVFCGGGTGGHVYPALTVARALRDLAPASERLEMLYVGVRGKMDGDLVGREGIPFRSVTARPLRTGTISGTARGALALVTGAGQAVDVLRRFDPDVVFATGGYGSVGVGVAAKLLRRPLLLFLPDVEAGMAVIVLSRIADRIAVTVEPALRAMPRGKTTLTGYPVRPAFFAVDRVEARKTLGLHAKLPTLLVSGASSGARRLSEAVVSFAADFLRVGQLVHLCGRGDESWLQDERSKLPAELSERYHLHAYLHEEEMAMALGAADVAVMRSGASVLGELPAVGLPAVLVPGEYEGWDQSPNARLLADKGAALMLPQSRLGELRETVMALLGDGERRQKMREALAALSKPDAATALSRLLIEMAGVRQTVAA